MQWNVYRLKQKEKKKVGERSAYNRKRTEWIVRWNDLTAQWPAHLGVLKMKCMHFLWTMSINEWGAWCDYPANQKYNELVQNLESLKEIMDILMELDKKLDWINSKYYKI